MPTAEKIPTDVTHASSLCIMETYTPRYTIGVMLEGFQGLTVVVHDAETRQALGRLHGFRICVQIIFFCVQISPPTKPTQKDA